MSDIVHADYERLKTVAQRFYAAQARSQQTIQSITRSVNRLKNGGWEGVGADAFFASMEQDIYPALRRLKEALGKGGDVTRLIADRLSNGESEAAALFRSEGTMPIPISSGSSSDTGKGDAGGGGAAKIGGGGGSGGGNGYTTTFVSYQTQTETPEPTGTPTPTETPEPTPEPPPAMTDEQQSALEALGITIPENVTWTEEQAQALIDFYTNNPSLIEQQATVNDIIVGLSSSGLTLPPSPYNAKEWTLEELQAVDGWVDSMADGAETQFLAMFGDNTEAGQAALEHVAAELGVPVEYAALRLLTEWNVYRDTGVNVDRTEGDGATDTVGYTGNETDVYVVSTFEVNGVSHTVVYDPATYELYPGWPAPPEAMSGDVLNPQVIGPIDRNARFFGWAFGNGAIFADSMMGADGAITNAAVGGSFTPQALFTHEFSHILLFSTSNDTLLGSSTTNWLTEMGQIAGTSWSLGEYHADIVMNGMLGTITNDTVQGNYEAFMGAVLAEDFQALTGMTVEEYIQAQSTPTPEATPDLTPTPTATAMA